MITKSTETLSVANQQPTIRERKQLYSFTYGQIGQDKDVTLTNAAFDDLDAVEIALVCSESGNTTVEVVLQSGQKVTVAPKASAEIKTASPRTSRSKSTLKKTAETSADLSSLSTGNRIRISGVVFEVTCIDRNVGEDGPLVELLKPSSTKTLYTLMRHAKEPGMFVLSSSRTSRDIDGWRKVDAT